MALINCPECNKEISSRVNSCPFCGYPFQENEKTMISERDVTLVQHPLVENINPKDVPKKKTHIGLIIILLFAIATIAAGSVFWLIPKLRYDKAMGYIEVNNYQAAYLLAEKMDELKAESLYIEISKSCLEYSKHYIDEGKYKEAQDMSPFCVEEDRKLLQKEISKAVFNNEMSFWMEDIVKVPEINQGIGEVLTRYSGLTDVEFVSSVGVDSQYILLGKEIDELFTNINSAPLEYLEPDVNNLVSLYINLITSMREIHRALPQLPYISDWIDLVNDYSRAEEVFWDQMSKDSHS